MIVGQNGVIRTAEYDDAAGLKRLYVPGRPRAALLDRKRELPVATLDELAEMLSRKDVQQGAFYAVEDPRGALRGFCSLRGTHPEVSYADFIVMFFDDEDYAAPLAGDVFGFLIGRAFVQMKLNKVMAQCLESETACRDFLAGRGFESEGVQRDVLFTAGRWHDLETLSLFRSHCSGLYP